MATIYLDSGVLTIAAPVQRLTLRDDAARMVGHLLASGHEVLLLSEADVVKAVQSSLHPRYQVEAAPDGWLHDLDPMTTGWFVTDSPARCAIKREHPRLRTVLVDSPIHTDDLAHRPADRVARSLSSAILEILCAEATSAPTTAS